jgi:hypothetical protein
MLRIGCSMDQQPRKYHHKLFLNDLFIDIEILEDDRFFYFIKHIPSLFLTAFDNHLSLIFIM